MTDDAQSESASLAGAASLCSDCGKPCRWGKLCDACLMRRETEADVRAALARLPPLHPQYSLATLFLSTTWIAVCLGALRLNPCFGMLLIFLTLPALLRTLVVTLRDRESGTAVTASKRASTFLLSLGIMFVVLVASGATFVICAAGVFFLVQQREIPPDVLTALSLLAMTLGLFGAVGTAAAILWSTRSLGA